MAVSKALLTSVGNVPASAQRRIREGFGYLTALSPEVRKTLFAEVGEMIKSGVAGVHLQRFVELTSLKPAQVASTINALSATISTVVRVGATTEDFLSAARGKFFDPEDEPVVAWTVNETIANSEEWNAAFELRKLANETLPALASFDISVDLRFAFKDDTISHGVAVALIHLDTDANGQEVWFQAGRADVEMMREALETALRQMELADRRSGDTLVEIQGNQSSCLWAY
jgi:hypothetical protein